MRVVAFTPNPAIDCYMKVPGFKENTVAESSEDFISSGGKGINIARILRRFKFPSTALFTQSGLSGKLLHELLRGEAVSFSSFRMSGETRRNYLLEDSCGRRFKINNPGPPLPENVTSGELADWVLLHCHKGDLLYIGGSLPAGLDSGFYSYIAGKTAAKGVKLALDVSAKYMKTVSELPYSFLKANLKEFSGISAEPINSLEQLEEHVSLPEGAELLVSAGASGVKLFTAGKTFKAVSSKIFPGLCVCCGDSLFAGYIMSRLNGRDLQSSLTTAVAFSLSCAFAPVYSLVNPDDVDTFSPFINITEF